MMAAVPHRRGPLDAVETVVSGRRVFDNAASKWMVKVYPGDCQVTTRPNDVLVTVLGSCVSACIRDPATGAGGMNHFMLPGETSSGNWNGDAASMRFGNFAMEKLINELLKRGCPRERMEIKVFGGGNVINSNQAIGTKNALFVLEWLREEGLSCVAQDLGGSYPRRIQYSPATGRVTRRLLRREDAAPIVSEEQVYARKLRAPEKKSGDVELFGDFE